MKKKVLHIISSMCDGGAQRVVYDYVQRKKQLDGYELIFLSLSPPTESTYDLNIRNHKYQFSYLNYKKSNCKIVFLRRMLNFLRRNMAIYKFVSNCHPDIIHTHITDIFRDLFGLFILFRGIKFHTMHSDPYRFSNRATMLSRFVFHWLNVHPIAVSEGQKKKAIQRYALADCDLLRNSIDINAIKKRVEKLDKIALRRKYNLPEHGFIIGSVGRLHAVKNYDGLLRIFAAYKHIRKRDAYLAIVGDGVERANLSAIAKELNITDSVFFVGNIEQNEVYEFYKLIDLFMLVSHSESSSIVTLEAQAVGVRCLLADTIPADVVYKGNVRRLALNSPVELWIKAVDDKTYINPHIFATEDNDLGTVMDRLKSIYDKYCF